MLHDFWERVIKSKMTSVWLTLWLETLALGMQPFVVRNPRLEEEAPCGTRTNTLAGPHHRCE